MRAGPGRATRASWSRAALEAALLVVQRAHRKRGATRPRAVSGNRATDKCLRTLRFRPEVAGNSEGPVAVEKAVDSASAMSNGPSGLQALRLRAAFRVDVVRGVRDAGEGDYRRDVDITAEMLAGSPDDRRESLNARRPCLSSWHG